MRPPQRFNVVLISVLSIVLTACASDVASGRLDQDDGTGSSGGSSGGNDLIFSCLGSPPSYASLCPGDDRDLSSSIDMVAVPSCTADRKCEYQCDAGYMFDDGACVLDPHATNICEATGGARCFYLAPNGSDTNDGSITAPFASTNPIIDSILPGDFIYFRGGEYGESAKGQIIKWADYLPDYYSVAYIRRSGEEGNPITFKAYPGELPVLDLYNINPEYDPESLEDGANNAFEVRSAYHIRISGFEIVHGSIYVGNNAKYTWIENNHVHDLLTNRDNNGLIMLYFTQFAYVRNNNLHDTYSRSVPVFDDQGHIVDWVLNTTKDPWDAQHNGCITTLSGDGYVGYGNETSGPFEFTNNDIHDCPVHLFIKNSQGESVDENGINILIKDNYFHGSGHLAEWFEASNVVFENNLFKDIDGISAMGKGIQFDGDEYSILNEISARNVMFRHNIFSNVSYAVQMHGQGFLLANGIYSEEMEDKFKFYGNVVVMDDATASRPGTMGWNQNGYVFGNSYSGMLDAVDTPPSMTLSRIDSEDNCFINKHGTNIAFLKHWVGHWEDDHAIIESITGYSHATSQTRYNINGAGDLFPSDTSPATHFTDPDHNDYSIKAGSPCAAIPNVGLLNPALFVN